jgi:hypothetical protein
MRRAQALCLGSPLHITRFEPTGQLTWTRPGGVGALRELDHPPAHSREPLPRRSSLRSFRSITEEGAAPEGPLLVHGAPPLAVEERTGRIVSHDWEQTATHQPAGRDRLLEKSPFVRPQVRLATGAREVAAVRGGGTGPASKQRIRLGVERPKSWQVVTASIPLRHPGRVPQPKGLAPHPAMSVVTPRGTDTTPPSR